MAEQEWEAARQDRPRPAGVCPSHSFRPRLPPTPPPVYRGRRADVFYESIDAEPGAAEAAVPC
jgi:hypothetical protein